MCSTPSAEISALIHFRKNMARGGMLRAPLVEPERIRRIDGRLDINGVIKEQGNPIFEESDLTDKKCNANTKMLLNMEERMPDKEIANWWVHQNA